MRASVRDSTALAVGSAASGLLAYLFFALGTRSLGAVEAAPVSVLWTYWSFTAAALTFPLQHWIARSVAGLGGEEGVRGALPGVLTVLVGLSALTGGLAWLLRDALFGRDDPWFPVLVGGVTIGSALIGIVRGVLSARHRFVAVGSALALENGARCLVGTVLVVTGVESAVGFGICLAAGSLVGFCWPSALVLGRGATVSMRESPLRFLSGASGGQLLGQAVLTGGPVVLALSGGSAAQVTALFAALALFRAPYTLGIGLVSQLTGWLTTLIVGGDHTALRRVRVLVVAGTVLVAAAAGVVGTFAGPMLLRLVFGEQVRLSASPSALVAVGSVLALASLVATVLILAQNRSGVLARCWGLAVLGGAVVFAVLPGAALDRTCWAFVAAEGTAFVVLALEELRGSASQVSRSAGAGNASQVARDH